MKNICLIIDSLFGAGAERVVINLAAEFVRLGHYVDIIIFYEQIDYLMEDKKINIHCLGFSKNNWDGKLLNKISVFRYLLRKIKASIVLNNSSNRINTFSAYSGWYY